MEGISSIFSHNWRQKEGEYVRIGVDPILGVVVQIYFLLIY